MMCSAEPISAFVDRHPTVKMLALSFLLLIGLSLIAEGLEFHIPKGYIYFAMGFSVSWRRSTFACRPKAAPVHLHEAVRVSSRAQSLLRPKGTTPEEHRNVTPHARL